MKPRSNKVARAQASNRICGDGRNWILIAGGALLSTLSMRLGYKLKQVLDSKQVENDSSGSIGSRNSTERKPRAFHLHPDVYISQEDDNFLNCVSGTKGMMDSKLKQNGQMLSESEMALSLVAGSAPEYKENVVHWSSSPDHLELAQKPFHYSNSFDSPCVSDSGSDKFSRREVIQKLRQQLKTRDDMILEMQDRIAELQNALCNHQLSHNSLVQSQLDAANRDLFDSEREVQRLRKVIADHCVVQAGTHVKPSKVTIQPFEGRRNGHANVYPDVDSNMYSSETGRGDAEETELLRREVSELKEVNEGKDYILKNFKEQNVELSIKVKELQQRLDSRLPNIL